MSTTRKDFLKTLCVSSACMCGFSSLAFSANEVEISDHKTDIQDDNQQMIQEWISMILSSLNDELDADILKKILKKSSIVHYNNLKMDEMLAPYVGNLDKFINFIEEKWGWKVNYNKATNTLIANENKKNCVCPISNFRTGINLSAMCYCSEGFAEKMFSVVAGVSASAAVISSIRKGDEKCVYQINFQ
jgi:hypothetical protein